MTDLTADLTAELDTLAAGFAPPCAVDVDLARATGRSAKRRRNAATIGSSLAVTGLAATLITVNLPSSAPSITRVGSAPSVNPSANPGLETTGTAGARLTGTDPLIATLAFGWLPDDVRTTGFNGDQHVSTVSAPVATLSAAGAGSAFSLTVLPAGASLWQTYFKGGLPAPKTPAPDVNGRQAYWTDAPGTSHAAEDGVVELRWEYAPNSWAQLDATIGTDTSKDIVDTVYKVAENAEYNQTTPVAMPLHLAQAPVGLPVTAATEGTALATHLTFSSDATAVSPSQLQIEVVPAAVLTPSPQKPPIQTITVDGHTAYLETSPTSATLSVFGADGMTVVIQATGPTAMADINAAGGIIGYFHTLTLLGSDPKNWTTAVVG